MGIEQFKNTLKGNVEGMKSEVVLSIVQNELNGLCKNFQFVLVGLRDAAAITELEEKSAEALDTLTANAISAKAAINNFLDLDSIESGSEGLLSSVLVADWLRTW